MNELDKTFSQLARESEVRLPVIICLFTGDRPVCACAMAREPSPPLGTNLDENFCKALTTAVQINESVHDGAIMLGRKNVGEQYQVMGWSYRLFPPEIAAMVPNRGSAFNSCLAMSSVAGVDFIYLISGDGKYCFSNGNFRELTF